LENNRGKMPLPQPGNYNIDLKPEQPEYSSGKRYYEIQNPDIETG